MQTQNTSADNQANSALNDPEIEALVSALEAKWAMKKAPAKRSRK